MADDFDQELDRGPEGSIITPILMGCGAMGLGCVFSVGAIAIGVMIFLPGIWSLISQFDNEPLLAETLPMVEANEQVVAAVGLPMETEFLDIDDTGEGITLAVGESISFISSYIVIGPNGSATIDAEGSHALAANTQWEVTSVVATLKDGTQIRVFPAEGDVPPPPRELAPPEPALLPGEEEGAAAEDAISDSGQDAAEEAVNDAIDDAIDGPEGD